eukprot:144258_1
MTLHLFEASGGVAEAGGAAALLGLVSLGLLDGLILGGQDELDVAGAGHVRANATVSTVGAAAHDGGTVDLDVRDEEVLDLEALDLGVRLGVGEEVEHVTARLLGPAARDGILVKLALSL